MEANRHPTATVQTWRLLYSHFLQLDYVTVHMWMFLNYASASVCVCVCACVDACASPVIVFNFIIGRYYFRLQYRSLKRWIVFSFGARTAYKRKCIVVRLCVRLDSLQTIQMPNSLPLVKSRSTSGSRPVSLARAGAGRLLLCPARNILINSHRIGMTAKCCYQTIFKCIRMIIQ